MPPSSAIVPARTRRLPRPSGRRKPRRGPGSPRWMQGPADAPRWRFLIRRRRPERAGHRARRRGVGRRPAGGGGRCPIAAPRSGPGSSSRCTPTRPTAHQPGLSNRLIDLERRHVDVPGRRQSRLGPGGEGDANYAKAIDRLCGAGGRTGTSTTSYGKQASAEVRRDMDRWRSCTRGSQGVFFDEMIYEDTAAGAEDQAGLSRSGSVGLLADGGQPGCGDAGAITSPPRRPT